jgi:hypothetical protein
MDDQVTLDTSHNWKRNTIIQHKCEWLCQSVNFLENFLSFFQKKLREYFGNCEFWGVNYSIFAY